MKGIIVKSSILIFFILVCCRSKEIKEVQGYTMWVASPNGIPLLTEPNGDFIKVLHYNDTVKIKHKNSINRRWSKVFYKDTSGWVLSDFLSDTLLPSPEVLFEKTNKQTEN